VETQGCLKNDRAARPLSLGMNWALPMGLLLISLWSESLVTALIWTTSLVWMGGACLLNAAACGRIHCYFTGPFFLVMAAASVLHGFAVIDLGPDGWKWMGCALIAGSFIFWWGSETIWGRYANR